MSRERERKGSARHRKTLAKGLMRSQLENENGDAPKITNTRVQERQRLTRMYKHALFRVRVAVLATFLSFVAGAIAFDIPSAQAMGDQLRLTRSSLLAHIRHGFVSAHSNVPLGTYKQL